MFLCLWGLISACSFGHLLSIKTASWLICGLPSSIYKSKNTFSLFASLLSWWQNAIAFQNPNATSFAVGFLYLIIPATEIPLLQWNLGGQKQGTRVSQESPTMGARKHSHFWMDIMPPTWRYVTIANRHYDAVLTKGNSLAPTPGTTLAYSIPWLPWISLWVHKIFSYHIIYPLFLLHQLFLNNLHFNYYLPVPGAQINIAYYFHFSTVILYCEVCWAFLWLCNFSKSLSLVVSFAFFSGFCFHPPYDLIKSSLD